MKKALFPVFILTLSLSGCFSNYMPPPPKPGNPATVKIAEAAASVSSSIGTLEGIRKAENPQYQKKLPNPNTFGMGEIASIDWTGPIGPLVKKIAAASGYRVVVLGNSPAIPIIVSVHEQNQPLAYYLRNADYQAGRKAYVKVYAKRRVIQLRYARG